MPKHAALQQRPIVFVPLDALRQRSCSSKKSVSQVIVGWALPEASTVVVAGLLPALERVLPYLPKAISLITRDPAISSLCTACGGPPVVVGELTSDAGYTTGAYKHYNGNGAMNGSNGHVYRHKPLTIDVLRNGAPAWLHVFCPVPSARLWYRRICWEVLDLTFGDSHVDPELVQLVQFQLPPGGFYYLNTDVRQEFRRTTGQPDRAWDRSCWWLPTQHDGQSDLEQAVQQVNAAAKVFQALEQTLGRLQPQAASPKPAVSVGLSSRPYLLKNAGACAIEKLVDSSLPGLFGGVPLRQLSDFGDQLHVRLSELCAWNQQLLHELAASEQRSPGKDSYLAVAAVVAIAFDIALGGAMTFLLLTYHRRVERYVMWFSSLLTGNVLRQNVWAAVIASLAPLLPFALLFLALTGLLGVSVMLSLVSDATSILTMHVTVLYTVYARVYALQLRALASLWLLFRGRKKNTLRGRVDTCECSVEQLLVGTLLFTPLLLLLPTTSVYYIFFSLLHMLIFIARTSLQLARAVVRSFPFFQALQYVWRPQSFPAGVWFELIPSAKEGTTARCTPQHTYYQAFRFRLNGEEASFRRPSTMVITPEPLAFSPASALFAPDVGIPIEPWL
eukprot:jgi/Chlat1/1410/Chrsp12S02058